ncbi:MAG: 3-dehydroquinate synthase [candidate division Zixibacteria bacterium]|nr:3-dehydroquinate synthase [candidate division Zixibacteria bacterium]
MAEIRVVTSSASYPILIGDGLSSKLGLVTKRYAVSPRVFAVFDAKVFALHGQHILRSLKQAGRPVEVFVMPSGEAHKNEKVLAGLYDFLLKSKISRTDLLLAIGGGVTTDIVGYAAATTLRGVRWSAVATTLLGMVDAAIGGKTGINHERGKNLIGAIWQPRFVLCDLSLLQTLPPRELVAGFGEIVKYAGLIGDPMLPLVSRLLDGDASAKDWQVAIARSAAYKARIVSKDEREETIRAYLNLGHTFAHAIEHSLGYGRLLHGEAVLVGLLGAVCLSMLAEPSSAKRLKGYYRLLLSAVEMVPKRKLKPKDLVRAMSLDKKRVGNDHRFVLLKAPGKPYITTGLPAAMITFAVEQMIADYNDFGGKHAPRTGR